MGMDCENRHVLSLRQLHLVGGGIFVIAFIMGLIFDEAEGRSEKIDLEFFTQVSDWLVWDWLPSVF